MGVNSSIRALSMFVISASILIHWAAGAEPVNLHSIESDLIVPPLSEGPPAAGRRCKEVISGYEGWSLYHTLYLPTDWQAVERSGRRFPVIVEYAGNGGYKNARGDVCTGQVEDCNLGYGLSGGKGCIWICLPFVEPREKKHARNWWGDADATAAYCVQAVKDVCQRHGGDERRVILTGFSRGAIACNYIGLRNDDIAKLWRAMLVHSHYDGLRKWPYADSDAASALVRLKRLKGRPQFISHENSIEPQREYLKQHAPDGDFTFLALPYPNHSDTWVLKDIPERAAARAWLARVLEK
jgi:hypothetical protein